MRQVSREKLVGEACEVDLVIENKMTRALLDTGSTVSTLALSFYKENFPHTEIRSFNGILELQSVDGNSLPYEGYIEVEIKVPGLQNDKLYPCLFLIVQDTNYHQSVPLLLGTNILKTARRYKSSSWRKVSTESQSSYTLVFSLSMFV